MSFETIAYEKENNSALITLNRLKIKCLDTFYGRGTCTSYTQANEDNSVGAIVMTGAGKGFVLGPT